MRRIASFIIILLIFAGCSSQQQSNSYKVIKVVDGDTFVVVYNKKDEKVRLIGVDTPESVKPDSPVEFYGREASEYTKKLIEGKDIRLEFDTQERDKYGRLLVYAYLSDGRMLNQVLLEEGYAKVLTVPPNVKYSEKFTQIQKKARENRKGLWNK